MRCPPPAPLAPPPPPALRRPSPPAHHPADPSPHAPNNPSLGRSWGGVLGVAADKFSGVALVLGAGRRWRGRSWSEGGGCLAGHAPDLQIPPRQPAAAAAADPISQSAGSRAAGLAAEGGGGYAQRGGRNLRLSTPGPARERHTRGHCPAARHLGEIEPRAAAAVSARRASSAGVRGCDSASDLPHPKPRDTFGAL